MNRDKHLIASCRAASRGWRGRPGVELSGWFWNGENWFSLNSFSDCNQMPRKPTIQVRFANSNNFGSDANEWKSPMCSPLPYGARFDATDIRCGCLVREKRADVCQLFWRNYHFRAHPF
jgi:hypothetical protein